MASNTFLRALGLAILAIGIWALAKYGQAMPSPRPADAPLTQFSAGRAEAVLARILGPQRPHPLSSAENAAVRARIIGEFARLGVTAKPYTAMGCHAGRHHGYLACGTVTDIVAPVRGGTGPAIILLAHYDSVPAGPGAADDGSGVATVLETARALRARGDALHPVIAVLTDGEEFGLLGAAAFLDNPQFKKQVGIVINAEARGSSGPSLLFQTSNDASRLLDLYADNVPSYATSSLFAEIYKFLPNDTDLTLFLRDGFPGYNFAFTGRVADYHTPLDTRANLSRATLQQQGDNMLSLAAALERTPYTQLKGHKDIYMSVLGRWLPRLAASWALPGALILLVLIAGAVMASRGKRVRAGEWLRGAVIFPTLVIGSVALGWLLSLIAQTVSGMPDPAYAHPLALRIALSFAIAAMALATGRLASVRAAVAGVWLWLAALGVVAAIFLPGASPYFLIPVGIAAVLLLASARLDWSSPIGQSALLLAAIVTLVIWLQFVVAGEMLMGLKLHPLFTAPAAIAVATLVPLLMTRRMDLRLWQYSVGGCLAAAVLAAIVAGLLPAYSASWPQRLNIAYIADSATGKTVWAADATAPLPPALRKAADFSNNPAQPFPGAWQPAWLAPAPQAQWRMPSLDLLANARMHKLRSITLGLNGSSDATMMMLRVPAGTGLSAIDIGQKQIAVPAAWPADRPVQILCASSDCASMPVTLDMTDTGPLKLEVIERRASLPAFAAPLLKARGNRAVPSQFGDGTMLVSERTIPAAK